MAGGPARPVIKEAGGKAFHREAVAWAEEEEGSEELTIKAWEALGKNDYQALWAYTQKCIELYQDEAKRQQRSLDGFPPSEKQSVFAALNNVATCYFIRGEALMRQNKTEEARQSFQYIIDNFGYAQYWDHNHKRVR